ncbi:MAG: polysaccharide biosynthesis protein, partial [Planctomycetota bacterium]
GIKRNLAISWLNHATGVLIGIFLMPYVLGVLGDETYGTWVLINSFLGYSCFLYLGFGETVARFVARYHARQQWDRLNQVVNLVLFAYVAMGLLALLIAAVVAWFVPSLRDWSPLAAGEIQIVVLLMGLTLCLALSTTVFGGVLAGIQRFDIEQGFVLISGIARLVLTVWLLRREYGLLTLAAIFLVVTVVEHAGHVVFAFRCVPQLRIGWRHIDRGTAREFLSFSGFEFLKMVSNQVLEVTDTVIIGLLMGPAATVPYYLAMRMVRFIKTPIQLIGRVFMPRAGQLQALQQHERLRQLFALGTGGAFLLATGVFVGATFFGQQLIRAWVGEGYDAAYVVLVILLGAQIVAAPADVVRSLLFGAGLVRVPALLNVAKAVANIALSLILIRRFGIYGVAFGTLIPVVAIELTALVPYALRRLQIGPRFVLTELLAPQMLPLATLFAYCKLLDAAGIVAPRWPDLLLTAGCGGGLLVCVRVVIDPRFLASERWQSVRRLLARSVPAGAARPPTP